jgi:hypothetical protein
MGRPLIVRFGGSRRLARCFAELFYDPEDGGDTVLRNVGYHSTHYTASYPRRRYYSKWVQNWADFP